MTIVDVKPAQSIATGKDRVTIVIDSANDVANLPTDVAPGSFAIVADTDGEIYILNNAGEWKEW